MKRSFDTTTLLFVVATILALSSAAPLNGFAPLQCNIDASIDSEDCLSNAIDLSSIVSEDETRALVIPCGTCVVVDYTDGSTVNVPGGLNVIGRLHFPPSANVVLRTTAVFVQGMWSMSIPEEGNSVKLSLHYDAVPEQKTLYPHGECCSNIDDFYGYDCNYCTEPENLGYKPFAVVGGQLDIRAIDPSCASWSKLKNVNVDTMKSIEVDTAMAQCVRPGDEILITSDSREYDDYSRFIVESVDQSTGELFFETKMNRVFPSEASAAEPQLAIEVALMRRDVVFHSEEDIPSTHWIGAHSIIFVTPDVVQTIQGVRFENFGQEGELGRYPIHFHVCGDTESLVSKNVIYDSNQRCIFIHNTNKVTVDDNVADKTRGHCYATETGAEENNIFSKNLASRTRDLRRANGQSDSPGDFHNEASSFWIRNLKNTFVNNVAAGGTKRGYWFELKDKEQNQLHPDSFVNNSAHSYGTQGLNTYKSGWKPTETNFIKGFVAFNNVEGVKFHINGDVTFENALIADNLVGVRYGAWNNGTKFKDSVFMLSDPDQRGRIGVIATFNNAPTRHKNMILENVVFRNFAKSATIKYYDHNLMEDDMGDPLHLYNVTMEPYSEPSIPKIDECDPIYRHFFMEDFDGTMTPSNMGPAFLIRDNDRMKAFLPEGSCTAAPNGECGAWCEGVCLRLVRLTPSGGLNEFTDYKTLQLTETATGQSYDYSLDTEFIQVVLPGGQYSGQFLDDNGELLVDYDVEVEVFAEPRCSDFVTKEDFVFPNSLPPTMAPTTPYPTTSPTIEPTRFFDKSYVLSANDEKCPSQGRLFKFTSLDTVDECHEKCFDMPSCNFFSYRSSDGMCMGCSLENASDLDGHNGFDAFELTSIKDSSDFNFELWNGLDGLNIKCPFGGDDRIGKELDLTKRECYQMCKDTPNCQYFTFEEFKSDGLGDCLLCQSDANFEYHKNWYTYELV